MVVLTAPEVTSVPTNVEKSVKRGRSRGRAKPQNLAAPIALAGRGRGSGRVVGPTPPAGGIGDKEGKPSSEGKLLGRGRGWGRFQPAEEVDTPRGQAEGLPERDGRKVYWGKKLPGWMVMRGIWDLAYKELANARVRAGAATVIGLMISEAEGLRRTMVLQGQARLGNMGRHELAGALEGKVWEMMEAGLKELKAARLDCLMGNGGRTAEGDRRKARKAVETVALGWRNLGKITLGDLTPHPPESRHFVHPSRSRQ